MMRFNVGRPQATFTPGPATVPAPPHPSAAPIDLEPHQFNLLPPGTDTSSQPPTIQRPRRKRKAEQDAHNERLSKRMSLLNLGMSSVLSHVTCMHPLTTPTEQNGQKLYVPVEQSQIQPPPAAAAAAFAPSTTVGNASVPSIPEEEPMQLDDTKHKVYIYNLDDELSSEAESDTDSQQGRLVFLPDIEKHLRANRLPLTIPKPILPNKDGELAGMQLVLYSDGPSSISVPEEQDSVRKAIIEARARLREKQSAERMGYHQPAAAGRSSPDGGKSTKISFATPVKFGSTNAARLLREEGPVGGPSGSSSLVGSDTEMITDDDADAMDID